jgi:cobalt/nickel transport system permease protein
MHVNTFDRYRHHDSLVHILDPRVKVVITLLFIVSNVVLPDGAWFAFLTAWVFVLLITLIARLSVVYILKGSLVVLPFMLAAVTIMFTLPGEALLTISLLGRPIEVTEPGLIRFLSIVVRSWLSVQMAILLTTTTQFPDLMHALRHLRVPALMINIISFMYRYLFVLADEAIRLMRARDARSAILPGRKGGGTVCWRAKVTGNMAAQLLIRSLDRSDRVYDAMLARGYRGQLLTLNPHFMKRQDWLWGLLGITAVVVIQAIASIP